MEYNLNNTQVSTTNPGQFVFPNKGGKNKRPRHRFLPYQSNKLDNYFPPTGNNSNMKLQELETVMKQIVLELAQIKDILNLLVSETLKPSFQLIETSNTLPPEYFCSEPDPDLVELERSLGFE